MRILKNYGLHVLIWVLMAIYLIIAPRLFTPSLIKLGKPVQTNGSIPAGSDQISYVVERLDLSPQSGERLYNLVGLAYILGQGDATANLEREIVLISDEKVYFFAAKAVARQPGPESSFARRDVNLDTLGFSAVMSEDAIQPGKYRIGIIFTDPSTGASFYWDKPARYLIKTPNTLVLTKRE